MDGFSVVSLTSSAATISNRALSSAEELKELIQNLDSQHFTIPHLSPLGDALHQLHQQVAQLQTALNGASAISVRLQTHLSQSLEACDGIAAVLNKQVMRLQADNLLLFDETFCAVHSHTLVSYCQLFDVFVKLLSLPDKEHQDAALDSTESMACLEQVSIASQRASETRDILLPEGAPPTVSSSKGPLPGDSNEPPPYEPAVPGPSSSAAAGPSSPALGFSMSSLTNSFKAMTSNLWPKPDPLATAFCQAALRGDVKQMSGFLAQGGNMNGRDGDGNTPLTCAILADKEEAVMFLLTSGANVSSRDGSKLPPVFLAASAGSVDAVRLLISKGADINQKSWSGQSFFVDVVASENVKGIQALLENGANANTTSISGRSVIAQVVKKGNIELATLLIRHGADVNSYDITGNSLIALAVGQPNVEMVRLLLRHGASATGRGLNGNTMLVDAISKRRMEIATLLLGRGADASARDLQGNPILVAVIRDTKLTEQERLDTANLLLRHGASPNVNDSTWSMPAMCYAMENGSSELVKLMLRYGASTDKKMKGGETLLLYAMDNGRSDQATKLVQHGADVNATDKKGRTPLMQAIIKGDLELIKLLRRYGADVNAGGVVSPAELAPAMNNFEILRLLGLEIPTMPPPPPAQASGSAVTDEAGPPRPQSPPPGYDKAVGH
ncbi:ankyrin repeat-containing domain protein [Ilyonectria robusta]|uniref:ankyrin repeat-containing domain protein n=1 Tax=Ilyonectria robusta TaxID=1079257 RepID=UPI001E8E7BAA|nr:ankyrin repeat-containing domain protein [Ilyonectria robusta]KAH8736375.1 ankyrin repeat-containing domain protein [Ilyonectria robusta]